MKTVLRNSIAVFVLLNLITQQFSSVTAFTPTIITSIHHTALHIKGASPMRFREANKKDFIDPLYLLPEQAKELVEAAKKCELMDDSFHVGVHIDSTIPRHEMKTSPPNDSTKTDNGSISGRSHTGEKKQRGQDTLFRGLFGKGGN